MLKNIVGALALTVFVFVAINVVGELAFPTPSAPVKVTEQTASPEPAAEPEPQETAEVAPEPEPEPEPMPDAEPEPIVEAAPEAAPEVAPEVAPEPVAAPEPTAAVETAVATAGAGDAANGKKIFRRKCKSCHTSDKGARNMTGPNLWGVVGRTKASVEKFSYSEPMKLKGGSWTDDDILTFIAAPRTFITDTKMTFAGLKKEQDRLDVLAFLKTLAD